MQQPVQRHQHDAPGYTRLVAGQARISKSGKAEPACRRATSLRAYQPLYRP
jgi:hypothetical protein